MRTTFLRIFLAVHLLVLVGLVSNPDTRPAIAQAPVHDARYWHPPTGGQFGHEHGDKPMTYLQDAFDAHPERAAYGWTLGFNGPWNTSAAENRESPDGKHYSFKGAHLEYKVNASDPNGFRDADNGWLDGWVRGHISGTPPDRGAMVHSFGLFLFDKAGTITIRQGHVNAGSPETARVPRYCERNAAYDSCPAFGSAAQRPITLTVTEDDVKGTYTGRHEYQEQWYMFGLGCSWAWGMNAATVATPAEKATDLNPWDAMHPWHPTNAVQGSNGLNYGQLRLIEVNCLPPAGPLPAGGVAWWTLSDGATMVSGPDAAECQPTGCVVQYVGEGFRGVAVHDTASNSFMHNRIEKEWPIDRSMGMTN